MSPQFPDDFDADAKDVITLLLAPDPAKRFGVHPNGMSDVIAHPFFAPIDFPKLRSVSQPIRHRDLPPLYSDDLLCAYRDCLSVLVLIRVCVPWWVNRGRGIKPPYVPEVDDDEDISNFEEPVRLRT